MNELLLVEDEKNFAHVLKDYLSMSGYGVALATNGEEGLTAFKEGQFVMCILDVMMPRKDGFTLGAEIRALDKDIPIIFLTARGMKEDMVKGYRLGADDYIVKPFDSELLLMKIKAILNRRPRSNNEELEHHTIGRFQFNARLRTLKDDHNEVRLSPKESSLLQLLCVHRNDVLTREKALKQIWKEDSYFTARSMDVYIAKLRKHLLQDPSVEINNVHGNGYTLSQKKS